MGDIIGFLLAVRKRSFWRTSPAGAHTVLIRVPEGMRRNGTDALSSYDCG